MFRKYSLIILYFGLLMSYFVGLFWFLNTKYPEPETRPAVTVTRPTAEPALAKTPKPEPSTVDFPASYTLTGGYHTFQTFNNCGPASLSMALSYYGLNISQQEIGQDLRPWQNPAGDNDDKSVTLDELAEKSKEYGFTPYHRPVGNTILVKQFIGNDIPVIVRTWTTAQEDIGHFRVIKGYNETSFLQDDSLQGKDIWYTYDEFKEIWKKFNYEYLVLIPQDKLEIAAAILGEDIDFKVAWKKAVELSKEQLSVNPEDIYARFNLSVALYNTGDYAGSVREFEKVESQLPFRTLWYQFEPIEAYYELGNYDRVFEITDRVLNYHNRAFSELYIVRGNIYKKQGNIDAAREQYELAVLYNENLDAAQEALESL